MKATSTAAMRGGVDGWVLDRDAPGLRLKISVRCGEILLGTCIANQFREDLRDGGQSDGKCAFNFTLPRPLSAEEARTLRISIADTDHSFRFRVGSPVMGMTPDELYDQTAIGLRQNGQQWRKFKVCILHIGTEKTGSTSLQSCFGLNRKSFEDSGYFIPRSLVQLPDDTILNHSHLAMLSMNNERFDDDLRRLGQISNRDGLIRARRDLFIRFSEEVAEAPESCHTIIMSNEHCHSRLVSVEEVHNLKDLLDHFCETYRIVVYLRPQHELAISQYGMFVANGTWNIDIFPPLPPPAGYDKDVYTSHTYFDYVALIDRWSQVFGAEALYPHIYAKDSLRGGDVVSDFTADLSLINAELELPPWLNTNASARGQEFLINFYRHFGDGKRFGAAFLRERIRNAVQACMPGPGPIPARTDVAGFLTQFAKGNDNIRGRWFPQCDHLFNVDLQQYPEVARSVIPSTKEFWEMLVDVLLMDQEMCFSLTPQALARLTKGLPPSSE